MSDVLSPDVTIKILTIQFSIIKFIKYYSYSFHNLLLSQMKLCYNPSVVRLLLYEINRI